MWDLPWAGIKPVSPALAGRFFTTAPPGKSHSLHIWGIRIRRERENWSIKEKEYIARRGPSSRQKMLMPVWASWEGWGVGKTRPLGTGRTWIGEEHRWKGRFVQKALEESREEENDLASYPVHLGFSFAQLICCPYRSLSLETWEKQRSYNSLSPVMSLFSLFSMSQTWAVSSTQKSSHPSLAKAPSIAATALCKIKAAWAREAAAGMERGRQVLFLGGYITFSRAHQQLLVPESVWEESKKLKMASRFLVRATSIWGGAFLETGQSGWEGGIYTVQGWGGSKTLI